MENLVFRADCKLVSEEFFVDNPLDLESFLRQESTRDLFLSAGGRRECHKVPSSSHISNLWVDACHDHYGSECLPPPQDPVSVATETDVKFPGFQLRNTVLNGCQMQSDKNGMLCYTFSLIGDRKVLQGSRPVVWLVKSLSGISNDPQQGFEAPETKAKTCIYAVPSGIQSIRLHMDIEFTTTVTFPKLMLKLLPASKETVEERGSKSIHQVVKKDAEDALKAAREAWVYYDKEQQKVLSFGRRIRAVPAGWSIGKIRPQIPFRVN